MSAEIDSHIQHFFRNKKVFVTGGTGFLGKVFIEKLLRTTEISQLYVLIRPKAGKDISERLSFIFKDPLFEKLHTIHPDPTKLITPISGDCTLPKLGLTEADRQELIDNVNVVINSAATVRFNEPLSNATQINVQATCDLMEMALQMKQLKSFVHISSAFANCLVFHGEERYYTEHLGITSDKLLSIKNLLGDDKLNEMETELVGRFPNTYCYTKSVAEEAVLKFGSRLPICIFRPGIILPTSGDPLPGWIDNLYGPMSVLYGSAYGVLRVMYGDATKKAGLVPVDYCANVMLACAWHTATAVRQIPSQDPPIYSLVPDPDNTLQWGDYKKYVQTHGAEIPLASMIWYPFLVFTHHPLYYRFLILVYHTLPGYVIDFLLTIMGKKPRMTKAYKKIHRQCDVLRYFVDNDFTFDTTNTQNLWNTLTSRDKRVYNFNMASLDWDKYFYNSLFGLRRFLAKEEPESIPKAKKLLKRLYMLHLLVHGIVISGFAWLLWILFRSIFLS